MCTVTGLLAVNTIDKKHLGNELAGKFAFYSSFAGKNDTRTNQRPSE